MKLLKLVLKNFKGIRHFELDTQGGNVNIFGDNAVGKTTLFDAFVWLLFDKDSQNKKDFQIKTLDAAGKVMSGLEHEVEAVFDINGRKLTLKKVFSEKWTKKRGSITAEFTGHTTDYFVNEVPVKKGEYVNRVEDIAKEDIFKLLTSPTFFNEQLHWEERRKILLGVCGDISDEDVIASNKSLDPLYGILEERDLEEHLKIIKSKKSTINAEIEKIPVRIDEVNRSLPDIQGLDAKDIQNKLDLNSHLEEELQRDIVYVENGVHIAEKKKEISQLERELIDKNFEQVKEIDINLSEKRRLLSKVKEIELDIKGDINSLNRKLETNQRDIAQLNEKLKQLRSQWHEVNEKQFSFEQDDTCPTCRQALPKEQLTTARDKALADFNRTKSDTLESINASGKDMKKQSEDLQSEKAHIEAQLQDKQLLLEREKVNMQNIRSGIDELEGQYESAKPLKVSPEINKLQLEITKLQANNQERISDIRIEIASLKQEAEELKADKAKLEQHENGQKRIKELDEQHKKLAREYEKLEQELYLCEEFIKTKVTLLDKKINSRFKYARFKLFKEQINGGVEPFCETLYNGVPYSSGLNNAARINVGIDIINTLSEHYGFDAPIFIDNAESVTEIAEANGQMICLVVSKDDKQLRTEVI